MMDAIIRPKEKAEELNDYQKRLIVATALRQTDGYPLRAERLKKLEFCTDAVKFEVLKSDSKINDKLYNELHKLYFAATDKCKPPQPSSTLRGPGWQEVKLKPSRLSTEEIQRLIGLYNNGTKVKELATLFRRSAQDISNMIYSYKHSKKYKELFTMSKEKPAEKPQEQEKKFEDIIQSVDAGSRKEPEIKDEDAKMEDLFQTICESNKNAARAFREMDMSTEAAAKAFHFPVNNSFCAEGTGLISTDGSIKLDDEPILAALRKEMVDSGNVQFYGTVQIIITPHKPTGMKVTRGCRE